jgi:hypothetical protein
VLLLLILKTLSHCAIFFKCKGKMDAAICIIDFNYYHGRNADDLIVKEIAIEKNGQVRSWIFEPPYSWYALDRKQQKINSILHRQGMGIRWQYGTTPYAKLTQVLTEEAEGCEMIVLNGRRKCELVATALGREVFDMSKVYNAAEVEPSVVSALCLYHSKYSKTAKKCALTTCDMFARVLQKHIALKWFAYEKQKTQEIDELTAKMAEMTLDEVISSEIDWTEGGCNKSLLNLIELETEKRAEKCSEITEEVRMSTSSSDNVISHAIALENESGWEHEKRDWK